jgi:hypothetical protein
VSTAERYTLIHLFFVVFQGGPSSQRLEILLCPDRSGIRVWACGSIWKPLVGKEEEEEEEEVLL